MSLLLHIGLAGTPLGRSEDAAVSKYPNGTITLPRDTVIDASYMENGRLINATQVLPSRIFVQLSPNTAGYKELKKTGGRLPMNNFYKEEILWSDTYGHRFADRTEVGPPSLTRITEQRNGLMYCSNTPNEYFSRWMYYQLFMWGFVPTCGDLVNSALKNVAHGPDVMTFLAELKDVKMLHKDIIRNFRKIGRGRFSAAWMTYRYGFLPLMYSIIDFAEYTAQFVEELFKSRSLTHGKSSTLTYEPNLSGLCFNVKTGDPGCKEIIHIQNVRAKGSVFYRVNGMSQAKTTLNINPWLTAWELIPLSFAIDWLVDVGSMLDACTVSASLAEPELAICTKWEFEADASAEGSKPPDPYYIFRRKDELSPAIPYLHTSYGVSHKENYRFKHVIKNRTVSRPAQVFPALPTIRPSMNLERYIDAMSLYSIFTDKELAYSDTKRLLR